MRVLYLIDSLFAGGAERSLAALAPHYRDLGVEFHVGYFYEREGLRPELEGAGARLHPLTGRRGHLGRARAAAQLIRTIEPDLVHTTLFDADVAGRVAARRTRRPVVSSLVNVNYGPEQLANPRIKPWRLRAAQAVDVVTARMVKRFHAVSGVVADEMAPRLRVRRDRIDVIPRGRDAAKLGRRTDDRRAAARAALDVNADDRVVLAIGRQEYQKGLDLLVDATASMGANRLRIFVAGRDGNETEELRANVDARRLGKVVTFLGERADVADLLCAADVFAFPSRWEGMPGTVIEAMALEAPIVASDIESVREVVNEECAVLVPPNHPVALGTAIMQTLDDPGTVARVARARQRFLDEFTIERSAAEMVRFYQRVLGDDAP